ncbi:MAG TPA: DALR domain-containing protein, partial [Candidatus Binatia bacterium]
GQPFDIHGGGADLIFPHHENEIAQSEGAAGKPFARYWMHNGFVDINHEKMSKSLGNTYGIQEVLEKYPAAALRQYMLSSHYRSPLDFSYAGLEEAEKGVERIYETVERMNAAAGPAEAGRHGEGVLEEFQKELDDDFNTPRALALVFEEVRSLNRMLDRGDTKGLADRRAQLKQAGEVLGILLEEPEALRGKKKAHRLREQGMSPQEIERMIADRNLARKEKRWADADRIRNELQDKGITLEDTPGGTLWKVR